MLSLMTRLHKAIYTFVSGERKLYRNLVYRLYLGLPYFHYAKGSRFFEGHLVRRCPIFSPKSSENQEKKIKKWLPRPWTVVRPAFGKGGAQPGVWGPSSQPPMNFYGFHIKKHSLEPTFYRKRACSECSDCSHYGQCKNIFAACVKAEAWLK